MKKITTIITLLLAALISIAAFAGNGVWTFDGDSNWMTVAVWEGGVIPNGAGDNAYFTNTYVDDKITVGIFNSQNITVGGIHLKNTRVQLPGITVAGYELSTNITLDAGGDSPIIDVFTNRLDVQCVLEGTDGFTAYGSSITGVPAGAIMLGATAKPISGTVTLSNLWDIPINHKDALMNADLVVGELANLHSRKSEMNTKSLTINNGGIFSVLQSDVADVPVKIQSESITVNNGGQLGAGISPAIPLVGESFDLLSPSITINSGGRIKVNGGNTKSVGGSNITVLAGGEVGFFNNFQTYTLNNPLVLDGWGIAPSLGALTVQGLNNLTNNGPITLIGNTRIGMWGGGDNYMVMNGPISGTGPCILLAQAGHHSHVRRFELHAANTYSGSSHIESFACQNITTLFGNQRLPHTPLTLWIHNWVQDTTNTFNLNSYTQTVTQLTVGPGAGADAIKLLGGGQLVVTSNNVDVLGGSFKINDVSLIANRYILVRSGNEMTVSNAYLYCGLELMPGIAASPGTVILDNAAEANVFVTRVGIDPSVESNDVGTIYLKSGSILKTAAVQNSGGENAGLGAGSAMYHAGGTLSDGAWQDWEGSLADWIRQGFSNVVQAGGAKIEVNNANGRIVNVPFLHDPALGGTEDGGLTKLGYGMLTLSNACNYTGPTVVESGTLILNTLGKTKFLAVDDATVGDVSGDLTITAGTTVSPGSSVGTMHTQSNLVMQSGSIYDWEVGAYYLADLINVNSKLDISGAAANSITVNVNSIGAVMPEETNILFAAGIIDGNASSIFMSYAIGNSGPVNPTINGNNIEIADIIIPEPGIVSIICLLTFAFFGRNKK